MNVEENNKDESLIARNIEGISTKAEDARLCGFLVSEPDFRRQFIDARHIHYLLKVLLDPSLGSKLYANRVKNALHPDALSENEFTAAVQRRLRHTNQKTRGRSFSIPLLRIAASVLIIVSVWVVFRHSFFPPDRGPDPILLSEEKHLGWHYQTPITRLHHDMDALYGGDGVGSRFEDYSSHYFSERVKGINALITHSENRWHLYHQRPYPTKDGDPL